MRTPFGQECQYFYGDYNRGKVLEECRLPGERIKADWSAEVCAKCPVPGIFMANGCENMILSGQLVKTWFGLKKRMRVTAYCKKTRHTVAEPKVGCGSCHPISWKDTKDPSNPEELLESH